MGKSILLNGRLCRNVPGFLNAGDAVGGVQPVVQTALRAVGGGIRVDDRVEIVAQGVAAIGKGVIAGSHAVQPAAAARA